MGSLTTAIAVTSVLLLTRGFANAAANKDSTTQPGDRPASLPVDLHAGPVTLQLAEGELRYLRVGPDPIVRRIYFAVRDARWNTLMPRFTTTQVDQQPDHFKVTLVADCKAGDIHYHWDAVVTGDPDGTIRFQARGNPRSDFASNRIGLCVLHGSAEFAGQHFQTMASAEAQPIDGSFPSEITSQLVASDYMVLKYQTRAGIEVTTTASQPFKMEDQRNYGDSSFKAYLPLNYPYPKITSGSQQSQTITIQVKGGAAGTASAPAVQATHVSLGDLIADRKFPVLVELDPSHKSPGFYALNASRSKFADASVLLWNYTPITHLPDNDMVLENLPTVLDQARTARSFAPHASLQVGPITLRPPAPSPEPLPRRPAGFAGAWAAAFYGELAQAGISKATFDLSDDSIGRVLNALKPFENDQLLKVQVSQGLPLTVRGTPAVSAFAGQSARQIAIWIVNLSAEPRQAIVENLPPVSSPRVIRVNQPSEAEASDRQRVGLLDSPSISLAPWDVIRIELEKK